MNSKKLISLAVLAVILGGLAYYTSKSDSKKPAVRTGILLFKDLPVNDIAEIHISKDSESITLSRNSGAWTCQEKQDHPVKYDAVRNMILKIADIKIGHLTPANDEQRKEIGMILPPQEGSGTLIEMRNAEGKTIESLLIGTTKESSLGVGMMKYPTGCFVSADEGDSIYLTKDTFSSTSPSPRAWLDSQLLSVQKSDIEEIHIDNPDSKPLTLVDVDGELQPDKLKKHEQTNKSEINSLTYILANLSFDDLAEPNTPEKEMGFSDPVILEAKTDKGAKYTLKIGATVKGKAERYARLSAELMEAEEHAPKDDKAEMTDDEKTSAEKAKQAREDERRKLKQEIDEMNNKFSKWTYTLALHKTDSVTSAYGNIIENKEK